MRSVSNVRMVLATLQLGISSEELQQLDSNELRDLRAILRLWEAVVALASEAPGVTIIGECEVVAAPECAHTSDGKHVPGEQYRVCRFCQL